jgi:hypothetical protein
MQVIGVMPSGPRRISAPFAAPGQSAPAAQPAGLTVLPALLPLNHIR